MLLGMNILYNLSVNVCAFKYLKRKANKKISPPKKNNQTKQHNKKQNNKPTESFIYPHRVYLLLGVIKK